jgi:hypothetical protein
MHIPRLAVLLVILGGVSSIGLGQGDRHSPGSPQGERYRLYSEPDAASGGGIHGVVTHPGKPIEQILAIPPDEPRLVYQGSISGAKKNEFSFHGLPMRKYDLIVIYDNEFYEGLNLHREENTLTTEDRAKIDATLKRSEPFFKEKIVHRLEGTTGRSNEARCICTYLRPEGNRFRRTFKIVMLMDVGPGWQVVRSRDLYPLWTSQGRPTHHHSARLGSIRVTDQVKDLGTINLDL